VSPKQQWTATGATVRKGEAVTFHSTGEVQLSNDPSDVATADGSRTGRRATNALLPNVPAGASIGRVGNGPPFPIGGQATVTMPAAGPLFLGINDDSFDDNLGEWHVEITRSGQNRH
jgi:hypothetical protein